MKKSFWVKGVEHVVINGLTLSVPANRNVAIIGRNGAGKSTLLRMIGGAIRPDRGSIEREGNVSWPLGFSGGFHPSLTGRQNARFIARVYGADTDGMVDFVTDFAELGSYIDMPFATYSTGMRARLAFGVSMAANFDCYLVDEITAVGDRQFREKCSAFFRDKAENAQLVMVSHSEATLRKFCDCALLLERGEAWFFDSLEDGLAAYSDMVSS